MDFLEQRNTILLLFCEAEAGKMMKKYKREIQCCLLVTILLICVGKIVPEIMSSDNSRKEKARIKQLVEGNHNEQFSKESWYRLKADNPDFQGYLAFETGLIEMPIVQGKDNDEYLKLSFERNQDTQGTPFMDVNCNLRSVNITVYGHNVYYDSSAKFSPLEKLTDKKEFDSNRRLFFFLEDEVREYETLYVCYVSYDDTEDFDYAKSYFVTAEIFHGWLDFLKERSLFNQNEDVSDFDHFLTLQTCRKWNDNEHLLVVCREVNKSDY